MFYVWFLLFRNRYSNSIGVGFVIFLIIGKDVINERIKELQKIYYQIGRILVFFCINMYFIRIESKKGNIIIFKEEIIFCFFKEIYLYMYSGFKGFREYDFLILCGFFCFVFLRSFQFLQVLGVNGIKFVMRKSFGFFLRCR